MESLSKKLDEYCKPDLYDKYIDFMKKYATEVLEYRKDKWSRKGFIKHFKIYGRKKFWKQFDSLSLAEQEKNRAEWEMGYEELVKRQLEDLDKDIEKIANEEYIKQIMREIEKLGKEELKRRKSIR